MSHYLINNLELTMNCSLKSVNLGSMIYKCRIQFEFSIKPDFINARWIRDKL